MKTTQEVVASVGISRAWLWMISKAVGVKKTQEIRNGRVVNLYSDKAVEQIRKAVKKTVAK